DLLRIEEPAAAPLADTIAGRTDGNPYDTIELINALRRDGALVPGLAGWQWDADELGRYVGRQDVLDLLAARFDVLPAATADLLEIMASLGGEVELQLLAAAAGLDQPSTEAHLRPAIEDGLLLRRPGDHRLR